MAGYILIDVYNCSYVHLLWQASYDDIKSSRMYSHRIPLTAYVLIALYTTRRVSEVNEWSICLLSVVFVIGYFV